MRTISEVGPGDFVKTFPNREFKQIKCIELCPIPNGGRFSEVRMVWIITTVDGCLSNHFQALSFFKKEDLARR